MSNHPRLLTGNESSKPSPSTPEPSSIITQFSQQIADELAAEKGKVGERHYVIYSKQNNSCVFDRATDRIFSNPNPKIVEEYLRRIRRQSPKDDGVVMTVRQATIQFFKHQKKS